MKIRCLISEDRQSIYFYQLFSLLLVTSLVKILVTTMHVFYIYIYIIKYIVVINILSDSYLYLILLNNLSYPIISNSINICCFITTVYPLIFMILLDYLCIYSLLVLCQLSLYICNYNK